MTTDKGMSFVRRIISDDYATGFDIRTDANGEIKSVTFQTVNTSFEETHVHYLSAKECDYFRSNIFDEFMSDSSTYVLHGSIRTVTSVFDIEKMETRITVDSDSDFFGCLTVTFHSLRIAITDYFFKNKQKPPQCERISGSLWFTPLFWEGFDPNFDIASPKGLSPQSKIVASPSNHETVLEENTKKDPPDEKNVISEMIELMVEKHKENPTLRETPLEEAQIIHHPGEIIQSTLGDNHSFPGPMDFIRESEALSNMGKQTSDVIDSEAHEIKP